MTRSFEALGFLSPDLDQFRIAERARLKAVFEGVEHAVAVAIAELQSASGVAAGNRVL
jgi:hypothetical protein